MIFVNPLKKVLKSYKSSNNIELPGALKKDKNENKRTDLLHF